MMLLMLLLSLLRYAAAARARVSAKVRLAIVQTVRFIHISFAVCATLIGDYGFLI
jgi:hypothetical protein